MTRIVALATFVLGVLAGLGLGTLFSMLLWTAFWLVCGVVIALSVDAAAGLSQRVCGLRAAVRDLLHRMTRDETAKPFRTDPTVKSERRKTIWVNVK